MSDPTLQTHGPMTSYIVGEFYLGNMLPAGVEYLPRDAPPPPWTEGAQWTNVAKVLSYPAGVAGPLLEIADRSNQSIPVGKGYAFWQTMGNAGNNWRCYFELRGVEGGSICLPGVGLYNLVSNPNAWTYLKPPVFDGAWAVSYVSTRSVGPITLSISYAPAQDGFASSRLVYSYHETLAYGGPGNGDYPLVLSNLSADTVMDPRPTS